MPTKSRRDQMSAQADAVRQRLGKTMTGSAGKAKPVTTVRPTGNPFKGKVGIKIKHKF